MAFKHGFPYLVIILGISLAVPVNGQGNLYYYQEAKTWDFGLRVGFTTSMINAKGTPNLDGGIKLGLAGGLFGRYQLADQWAMQGDLSFSTRGNKNESTNITNSYLDFNLVMVRNIKYRMFKQEMTFDFFLGPGISYLAVTRDESALLANLGDNFTASEFNLVIGGGLPFGPVLLLATTRLGLTNLLASPASGTVWYGFTTEWTIAYRFR